MPSQRPLIIDNGQVKTLTADLSVASSRGQYLFHSVPFNSGSTIGQWAAPTALTELFNSANYRIYIDLNYAVQCRLQVTMLSTIASGLTLKTQYSTNGGTSWADLSGSLNLSGTAGIKLSQWFTIDPVPGDVLIRLVTQGGTATNVRFGNILLFVE